MGGKKNENRAIYSHKETLKSMKIRVKGLSNAYYYFFTTF